MTAGRPIRARRHRARAKWLLLALLGLFGASVVASEADARPGGGHSYSGGGGSSRSSGGSSYRSSSGGGGGGGGADALVVGIGVALVVVFIVASAGEREHASNLSSLPNARPASPAQMLPLVQRDPAFSQVAFEDFAFELYARAQRARARPDELAALTPYLADEVIDGLARSGPVQAVVIGSLRMIAVGVTDAGQRVETRIEANLASKSGTVNVIERWVFWRGPGAQTRAPDRTRTFPCPQCNAPFATGSSPRTCAHCGNEMTPGRFDWTVTTAITGASTSVGMTLTGTVAEVGNDLPTIVAEDAYTQMQALYGADKDVTWDSFAAHTTMIYHRLNTAWNAQDLAPVRGLVTSSLLGYLQFWIDEYKRQGLANRLEDAKIHRIVLAKVTRDPFYDAITVRVVADGHDYTIRVADNNAVVGGSKTARRMYTEYWTFIRSAARRGPVTTEPKCPNCGAPLAISDAGDCTHCKAHVENGNFDWSLSKIEQDEVYTG